jgi:hypothetical protein
MKQKNVCYEQIRGKNCEKKVKTMKTVRMVGLWSVVRLILQQGHIKVTFFIALCDKMNSLLGEKELTSPLVVQQRTVELYSCIFLSFFSWFKF